MVVKAINTLAFILIARWAGASQAGIFSLGTTYLVVFSAASWGLNELLIRQVARDRSTSSQYFYSFLCLQVLFALTGYTLLYFIVGRLLGYQPTTYTPILVLGISLIPDSLGNIGQSLLAAHERFFVPTISGTLASLVKIGGTIYFMTSGYGLLGVCWVWTIGSCLGATITILSAAYLAGRMRASQWLDRKFWIMNLKLAVPFIVMGFLLTLEFQNDVIILSLFRNEIDVGWYGAVTTIIFALTMLAQGFRAAVYPLMAIYHKSAPEKLAHIYDLSFFYLGAFVLPMAVGLTLMSKDIILLLYGKQFLGSILPLQIIAWFLIFSYLNVPNARLMLVSEQQNRLTKFLLISMITNIVLNFLLDPKYGAVGASVARLCSALVFFIPNYLFVIRNIQVHNLFSTLAKPFEATLIMGIVVWFIHDLNLWMAILTGIIVYMISLLLLRGISIEERSWLEQLLHPKTVK